MEAVPQTVANCKILSKLGQGGMGSVFRSIHLTLGRRMAIKVLPTEFTRSPEYVSRFLREARAIANLNHPNIVLVHDAGEQNGIYYIAMELVDGASLAAVTRHCSRLPEPVALEFLQQATKGLGYAHERGLVHRDIKPENILVNREGTVKVVDFGLVLEASSQSHLTRTGTFLGTPTFMSPEQCDGDVADSRSDLYALGATFYCILTGRAPFTATTALGIMYKHKFEAPPPLDDDISAQTCAIILKLLAKKREDRYQTAKDLIADVATALRTVPPKADWSLDAVLEKIAPPQPDPTAEELALPGRGRSSETVTMRGKPGAPATGNEFPSAGPMAPEEGTELHQPNATPASGSKSASAWDPTVISARTPPPPGATPAPSPLPGTITPAPATGAARTGLWIGVAAVVLLGVGVGSYFFYQNYRHSQLQDYVQNIEGLCKKGDLAEANFQIRQALSSYPGEPRLDALFETIKAEIKKREEEKAAAQRQAGKKEGVLASEAQSALKEKKFDDAIRSFRNALTLNPDSEEAKDGLREAHLGKLQMLMAGAEEGKATWVEALTQARECLNYGGAYEDVERLEQRLKVEDLRKEAQRLGTNNELLAAADKFDEAANFSTRDATLRDEFLRLAIQQRTKHHLSIATEAEKQGEWANAIAALNNAHDLAPKDPAIGKRLETARKTFREKTSFAPAMKLGKEAMTAQKWTAAKEMFEAALDLNKGDPEATALLAETKNREVLSQADTKVQARLWRDARTMLDTIKADIAKTAQTAVKIEFERLSMQIQDNQDTITRKEESAQAAAKNGTLQTAIDEYEALIKLNPADRANYEKTVAPIRIEHAYRERLAEGDAAATNGQFAKARAAYQQAADKKKGDAAAQATVNGKLALLVASEKLLKVEPLMAAKNWSEARTQLAAIQKEIPADNKESQAAVVGRLKTVDDALAQINAFEKTVKTAAADQKWDDGRNALKQLMELNPAQKDAYQKQLDELEAAFKAFNEREARQARYKEQLGQAREKLGKDDFDGAIAAAKQAQEAMPNDAPAAALIKESQEKKEAKALAKLLNDTHQNVAGLLSNGRLDDAATAAQTAAQQNPTVRDINTMSSALKEIQNAKPAAATASKLLEDSRALVAAQAPADAKSLQEEFTSAKEKLTQQEASALEQFKARNYAGALNTAGTLSAGAVKEACRKVEAVATALDKRGDDAAKANAKFRNSVGEMGVDDSGPAKPDPKKAIPYQNAAKALRALVPPGVR